jgi:hypothetical protein
MALRCHKEENFRLKFSGILVGNTNIPSMFDMFLYVIYEYYNKDCNFSFYAGIQNTSFESVLVGGTLFRRNGYARISLVSANALR